MSLTWQFGALVVFSLVPRSLCRPLLERATKQGVIASILAALVSWAYFFHLSGYGGEYFVGPGIVPAAICFLAASVALVVVSLMTEPPSKETLKEVFP